MTPSAHSMFERRVHALVAGLSLLAIAVVITVVVAIDPVDPALQGLDQRWLDWMVDVRSPWLTRVAKAMSVLGGPWVMVPLRLVVIGALAWTRRWLQLGAFVGAVVTSELCIGPLKAIIDRPRPPGGLTVVHSASFPSGHAIAASVTAIGLVVVLAPVASRRWRWTVVAAVFAAIMAMSRTYLVAHWASDVIAGACLGTGLAVIWPAALELERSRRSRASLAEVKQRPGLGLADLRAVTIALVAAGGAAIAALHLLRPELGPTGHRLSEYANGPYGYVMTTAFIVIGVGLVAMGLALLRADDGWQWSWVVAVTVAAAGVGMVVSGIYPTDTEGAGSTSETIHSRASAFATLALIAAAVVWSMVRPRTEPRGRRDAARVLAITAAAAGGASPLLHRSAWTGVSQRLLWLTLMAWLIVTAWGLRPERRPAPDLTLADTPGRS